jgi:hypothetical protein
LIPIIIVLVIIPATRFQMRAFMTLVTKNIHARERCWCTVIYITLGSCPSLRSDQRIGAWQFNQPFRSIGPFPMLSKLASFCTMEGCDVANLSALQLTREYTGGSVYFTTFCECGLKRDARLLSRNAFVHWFYDF